MSEKYPKLVRDKIPEIIKEKEGFEPSYRVLKDDTEFLAALLKKIAEEAREVEDSVENNNMEEELADLQELIDTAIAFLGRTAEDIKTIQDEKRRKRGGFERRILMDEPRKPRS